MAKVSDFLPDTCADARGRAGPSYERAETLFRDWTAALLGQAATVHQLCSRH